MSATARKILERKADMLTSDLGNGGLLEPEQASAFFQEVIEASPFLQEVRTVMMTSPKREISKIGLGAEVLKNPTTQPITNAANRTAPTFTKVELDAKKLIAEVRIPYDALEDNIEGQSMADTVISMLARAASRDLSKLFLVGDTTGAGLLATLDGVLKKVTTNVIDATGDPFDRETYLAAMNALEDRFKGDLLNMRHWTSIPREMQYRNLLAEKDSALGDAVIQGRQPVFAFGTPAIGLNFMPDAPSALGNHLFIDPRNIVVGFHREVMIETDRNIEEQYHQIVLSLRADVVVEDEKGAVKTTNLSNV